MITRWISRLTLAASIVGTALLAPAISSATTSAPAQLMAQVSPQAGAPGSRFVFAASGFVGDNASDDDDNDAERLRYWIVTPNGFTITQPADDGDDDDEEPFSTRANRDGSARWEWTAPADAAAGSYTMVAHGTESTREVRIPFTVGAAPASQQVNSTARISPEAGESGTRFRVTASGFKADGDSDDDGNDAERVAYWINTPSGDIIDKDGTANDDDDDTRLLARANRDGSVTLEWTAPADAQPGNYTFVLRGTTSGIEQTVAFSLR